MKAGSFCFFLNTTVVVRRSFSGKSCITFEESNLVSSPCEYDDDSLTAGFKQAGAMSSTILGGR